MLAVVKDGPGPGFSLREVPEPEPGRGEVRVRVGAVGICGSDLPILSGTRAVPYPLVPGHEFAGTVDRLGAGVEGWSAGDRVAVNLVVGCGQCAACRAGRENLCPSISEIGIHRDGAFAEYVAVPARCLYRLPESMDFIAGATVDPVASAYRGLRRFCPGPDDDVVVFGAGPIGLYAVQAVRAAGAASVTLVARGRNVRTEAAERLGATIVIPNGQGLAAGVAAATGGRLGSLIVEATGDPCVLADLATAAAPGARILLVGVFGQPGTIDPTAIVRRELRLEGSICYSAADFAASLDLLARRKVQPVVSHVLPLRDIADGLAAIQAREAIKVILQP